MNKRRSKGQAIVELLIVLPILFFMMIFSFQIFKAIYSAELTQELARSSFLRELNNRANGWIGMPPREVMRLPSSSVQTRGLPLLEEETPSGAIDIKIGICREPNC